MSVNKLENILALYSVPSVGSYKTRQLISVFGSAEKALEAKPGHLKKIPGIGQTIARNLKESIDYAFVERQLTGMEKGQHRIISFWDPEYPEALKNIYDPPILLFYRGNTELFNKKLLAVVGTRRMTEHGKRALEILLPPLRGKEVCIVSGMARGVDTMAHRLCLANDISTIGVIAHGFDRIYPPENVEIWKQMCEKNLIISEYPLGTNPDPGNFPRRNRIISGISRGVLVVEAGEKSGALITADYAAEQNRDVLAVPGAIHLKQTSGPNKLIFDGALPVYSSAVLQDWLGEQRPEEKSGKKETEQPAPEGRAGTIYSFLDYEPRHVDQIALKCGFSLAETLSLLLEMELDGQVRQLPGKMFVRT
jgi:DNA processing protein